MTAPEQAEVVFLRKDRDYWRGQALRLRATVQGVRAATDSAQAMPTPPEPPEGSKIVDSEGRVRFTRGPDGWYCAREPRVSCRNCPEQWETVCELGDEWMMRRVLPGDPS